MKTARQKEAIVKKKNEKHEEPNDMNPMTNKIAGTITQANKRRTSCGELWE